MTSLKQLNIFANIVEKGSFTAAAESLFMTQPALSWQIKKLEDDLEVSLFKKKDRNLELSDAGELVYRAAKDVSLDNPRVGRVPRLHPCIKQRRDVP